MFRVGRIPVFPLALSAVLLILQAGEQFGRVAAQPPAAAPENLAVPVDMSADSVLTSTWIVPEGHVTDRRLLVRLTRLQEALRDTPVEELNFTELLEPLHKEILAAEHDAFVTTAPENAFAGPRPLRSLKAVVEDAIAELPLPGGEAWERLAGARAAAELQDATRRGNWSKVMQIASQDVHTSAGYEASDRLANLYLDRGQPVLALRQLQRLLNSPSARRDREPFLSLRTAAAWTSLSEPAQARLALADLTRWMEQNPAAMRNSDTAVVPLIAETSDWIRQNAQRPKSESVPSGSANWKPFIWNGFLPVSTAHVFSPSAAVSWTSSTSGFRIKPTDRDRNRFRVSLLNDLPEIPGIGTRPNAEANDEAVERSAFSEEEPYPQTEAESAALVELGLEHLEVSDRKSDQITLPACDPVLARGQIIFRTLNRIRAVDAETGALRWESFLSDPAFAEQFDLANAPQSVNVPKDNNDLDNPLNKRQAAVVRSRTRIDRTFGTLTTNGKLVYSIEDTGITSKAITYSQPGARRAAPSPWNRLCAYDTDGGLLQWEIGGPEGDQELPVSGLFFLGVPTVHEDSLYVLGDEAGWVQLLCLDPATGLVKWQQPVGAAVAGANTSGLRRIAGLSPTVADGLILCPLGSGLIVAFDADARRLAWASQYRSLVLPRQFHPMRGRGTSFADVRLVDPPERWRFSTTIAAVGRIITTPIDSQQLHCLDAVTGRTLWQLPRGRNLFIGAVLSDRVILIADSSIKAVRLDDGSELWKTLLNRRVPTGRPVRTGNLLHLPVRKRSDSTTGAAAEKADSNTSGEQSTDGRLVTIDLLTGRLLAESPTPDGQPLGNLMAYHGRLLSQRFDSVVALESLPSVEARLAESLKADEQRAKSFEERARIRLHQGQLDDGYRDLRLAVRAGAGDSALELLVEQALEQLRTGTRLDDETEQTLAAANLTAEQRNSLDRARTVLLLHEKDYVGAFKLILDTPVTSRDTGKPFNVYEDTLTISSQEWVAAQLESIYSQADEARQTIDAKSASNPLSEGVVELEALINDLRQEAVRGKDPGKLRDWLTLFHWHHSAHHTASALIGLLRQDVDNSTDNWLEIESLITGLMEGNDESRAGFYQMLLIDLQIVSHQYTAAAASLQNLGIRYRTLDEDDRKALEQFLKERLSTPEVSAIIDRATWPKTSPKVTTADQPVDGERRHLVDVGGERSPAIQGWVFEMTMNGLTAHDTLGRPVWTLDEDDLESAPLLTTSRHMSSRIYSSAHLLAICTGTEFSVFDIRDSTSGSSKPRRLWGHSFINTEISGFLQMRRVSSLGSTVLMAGDKPIGSIDFLNSHSVVCRQGSTLQVLDARDGQLIWSRNRIHHDTLIFGGENLLQVVSPRDSHCQVFDLRTGRLIREHFEIPLQGLQTSLGADLIVRERLGVTHRVSRFDAVSGKPVWEFTCPSTAILRVTTDGLLVEMHQTGRILFRDIFTGAVTFDQKVDAEGRLGGFSVHETARTYVLLTTTPLTDFKTERRPLALQGTRQDLIHGHGYGIDRRTGQLLWSRQLGAQFIAEHQPPGLPVAVLASQTRSRQSNPMNRSSYFTRHYPIEVLDTRTGETIYSSNGTQDVMNYRSTGDADKRTVSVTFGDTAVTLSYRAASKGPSSSKGSSQPKD